MRPDALVDTGFLLALLDRGDRWHEPCVAAFGVASLPLATSAAVLAELFHLVGESPRDVAAAWRLLRSGAVTLLGIDDADAASIEALMAKYGDVPMDFADATLVHLARRESISTVLSIDNDDFETYRIDGRRRFRILPGRALPVR